MRHLVVYKNPRSNEWKSDSERYDSYNQHYYDDDMYYGDNKQKYRQSTSQYYDDPYEDDYDYEDRHDYYRMRGGEHYKQSRIRNHSFVLPNEEVANMIMNATAFGEYVVRHGYHFTPELADCASKMLFNANKREHRWTCEQIKQHLAVQGITDLGKCTIGDITFLANMAYADFYPEVLPNEHACIKYAIAISKDPDGYDGIVFSRWIADLIGRRETTIEWERYV